MADATTIYDIESRYKLKDGGMAGKVDRTARKVKNLSGAWDRARDSMRGFTDLWHAGRAISGGFSGAYRALIGFNSGLEQSRITMAGMIRLNTGLTMAQGFDAAQEMVSRFQHIAKASVGTTKDFVGMATMITRPVLAAKLHMSELVEITKGATIAAKAFGIQAEVAALDIEQVLAGTAGKRERFARALLEPLGFTMTQLNKMSAKSRAQILKSALTQPAIAEMASMQEKSFSGVMSTFQDNLEMTIGKVGLPLFQKLTGEVKSWNDWIDANSQTLEAMGTKLGSAMVHGFGVVKDAVGFLVENRDIFFALAKTFLAFKVGKMGVGFAQGIAGQVKGFVASIKKAKAGVTGFASGATTGAARLASFAGGLGMAIPALFALGPALGLVSSAFKAFSGERKREKQRKEFKATELKAKDVGRLLEAVGGARQRMAREDVSAGGRYSPLATVERARAQRILTEQAPQLDAALRGLADRLIGLNVIDKETNRISSQTMNKWKNAHDEISDIGRPHDVSRIWDRAVQQYGMKGIEKLLQPAVDAEPETRDFDADVKAALAGARNVTNVTVQRIEVAAADPDRFVHAITRKFEQFNRAPTMASTALRGGF